jgi:hypothetical protein
MSKFSPEVHAQVAAKALDAALESLVGKAVDLYFRFADGRCKRFERVKLLSVGPAGGMFYDGWPRSFQRSELVACAASAPRMSNADAADLRLIGDGEL